MAQIAEIDPVSSFCDGCDPNSPDYARKMMDEFSRRDFSEYCLAYLFTAKDLRTTMRFAKTELKPIVTPQEFL